jgi:hypothetical protein
MTAFEIVAREPSGPWQAGGLEWLFFRNHRDDLTGSGRLPPFLIFS